MAAVKQFCRASFSNCPKFGSEIAKRILKNPAYKQSWFDEVRRMARRMNDVRHLLVKELERSGSTIDWSYIA